MPNGSGMETGSDSDTLSRSSSAGSAHMSLDASASAGSSRSGSDAGIDPAILALAAGLDAAKAEAREHRAAADQSRAAADQSRAAADQSRAAAAKLRADAASILERAREEGERKADSFEARLIQNARRKGAELEAAKHKGGTKRSGLAALFGGRSKGNARG